MSNAVYRSCCNDAGLVWKNGRCQGAKTMTCAEVDDKFYNSYDKCVRDAKGYTDTNEHYSYVCEG